MPQRKLNIGFGIVRNNNFRTLGPVIETALHDPDLNVEIVLLVVEHSYKADLLPDESKVPERLLGKCPIRKVVSEERIDKDLTHLDALLLSCHPAELLGDHSKPENFMLFMLYDAAHSTLRLKYDRIKNTWGQIPDPITADIYLWPTENFMNLAISRGLVDEEILRKRSRFVGYPRRDYLDMIDPSSVRKEWGIPENKKVVLFIPDRNVVSRRAPLFQTEWYLDTWLEHGRLKRIWQKLFVRRKVSGLFESITYKYSYESALKAIRHFCDNNNAYLVMASRRRKDRKDGVSLSAYEKKIADHAIDELELCPHTFAKSVIASDLVISTSFTESILDSIALERPYVTLCLPEYAINHDNTATGFYEEFRAFSDNPGVAWMFSVEQFFKKFADCRIEDFTIEQKAQDAYFKKYIGPKDTKCAERILAEMKKEIRLRDSVNNTRKAVG